jgi:hypothetical protein
MKIRIKERYLAVKLTAEYTDDYASSEICLYPGMEFEANIVKDYGMFVDFKLKDVPVFYNRVSKRVFDELYDGQLSIGD